MKIGILGTGVVGTTIGSKLAEKGHSVRMGSRSASNEKGKAWAAGAGATASLGTFADAAAFGEVVINGTKGDATLEVLNLAGKDNLNGKILIDIANPLDFSKGMPPSLTVCNTDSLGEQIQRAFPEVKVVKTLNTMNCFIMVDPGQVAGGDHTVFLSGNDAAAKGRVREFLGSWFGWKSENMVDLGDITTARGTEMILPLWVRIMGALQSPWFQFRVVRKV